MFSIVASLLFVIFVIVGALLGDKYKTLNISDNKAEFNTMLFLSFSLAGVTISAIIFGFHGVCERLNALIRIWRWWAGLPEQNEKITPGDPYVED